MSPADFWDAVCIILQPSLPDGLRSGRGPRGGSVDGRYKHRPPIDRNAFCLEVVFFAREPITKGLLARELLQYRERQVGSILASKDAGAGCVLSGAIEDPHWERLAPAWASFLARLGELGYVVSEAGQGAATVVPDVTPDKTKGGRPSFSENVWAYDELQRGDLPESEILKEYRQRKCYLRPGRTDDDVSEDFEEVKKRVRRNKPYLTESEKDKG